MKSLVASLCMAASLAGCMTASPDVVHPYDAQRMSQVLDATVLSVRPVVVDGQQSGVGAAAGGVTGMVAGSQIGGWRDSMVGGVVGAVAGAVVGNAIERGATRQEALEIMVQLRNGERRSIVQAIGQETFAVGDPVLLVTSGGRTRVQRAPAVAPPPTPYR